jgi:hypothetical protein
MGRRAGFVGVCAVLCLLVGAATASASWTIQPAPIPTGGTAAQFNAVSCATATGCMAVGTYNNAAGAQKALSEQLSGGKWSVVPIPSPSGETSEVLSGVSCPTLTTCETVGSYVTAAGVARTLIERWTSGRWGIETSPNLSATGDNELLGVSCSAVNVCSAVGGALTNTKTVAERLNGAHWLVQPTPTPPSGGSLAAVTCLSATFCMAVGSGQGSLTETWNGASWTIRQNTGASGFG